MTCSWPDPTRSNKVKWFGFPKKCRNHTAPLTPECLHFTPIFSHPWPMSSVDWISAFHRSCRSTWLNAMSLDVHTLFYVTIYVEVILGLLLLFAWAQNTATYAVAWWGFAHFLRAGSVMLFGMNGSVSDLYSIDLANTLLFTAFALTWTGARVFGGRRPQPRSFLAARCCGLFCHASPALPIHGKSGRCSVPESLLHIPGLPLTSFGADEAKRSFRAGR